VIYHSIWNRGKYCGTHKRRIWSTLTIRLRLIFTPSISRPFHRLYPDHSSWKDQHENVFHEKSCRFVQTLSMTLSINLFPTARVSWRFIVGMRCNYRVTCDDRAWNTFLKKGSLVNFEQKLKDVWTVTFLVSPCIEFGEFHSISARPGPTLCGAARKNNGQRRRCAEEQSSHLQWRPWHRWPPIQPTI
jgi:hypothetical protein